MEDFPILVFTWGLPGMISTRFGAQLRAAAHELRVCKPLRSFLLLAALRRVSLAMMSSLAK